jgi:hypothetical protein
MAFLCIFSHEGFNVVLWDFYFGKLVHEVFVDGTSYSGYNGDKGVDFPSFDLYSVNSWVVFGMFVRTSPGLANTRISTDYAQKSPQSQTIFFRASCLLTNFLHRRRLDYTMWIFGEENFDELQGWDGNFSMK